MVVYESMESRSRDPADTERFETSFAALREMGIRIGRVTVNGPEDLDPEGEASRIVAEDGMSALPITEYQDVDIAIGRYPSDQELVDFLDAPDGTFGISRSKAPAMNNDLMPNDCTSRPRVEAFRDH